MTSFPATFLAHSHVCTWKGSDAARLYDVLGNALLGNLPAILVDATLAHATYLSSFTKTYALMAAASFSRIMYPVTKQKSCKNLLKSTS